VRYQDTFITADGRVTQDPAEAVRIDRDWYDDDGQLVRREWFHAACPSPTASWASQNG